MTKCDKCKDPGYLDTLFELCKLDPETQRRQMETAEFYKVYPEIIGLAYSAAEILRREKNLKIQRAAIGAVAKEIKRRADLESPNYSISRRRVTADQVREIVNEQHIVIAGTDIQREKLAARKVEEATKDTEVLYTCPLCQGLISVTLSKRDKIVSLRVTEDADDAYAYLAKRFDVPRSFLLSELLAIQSKFPSLFL